MDNEQLKSLLVNPKFWGAIIGLLTTLGISYFKNVDPNVLVGAIITVISVFVGGSAYENGKKAVAAAHIEAAGTAARAFRAAQPPATMPGLKEYITTGSAPQAAPAPSSSPAPDSGLARNLAPYLSTPPKE